MSAVPPSLTVLFDDLREGKPGSRNAVLVALRENLTRLTVAILRQFPVVQQRREADSLFQQLSEKLLVALDDGVQPVNPTEFVKFAAYRLRQMLTDEADKIRRRKTSVGLGDSSPSSVGGWGLPPAPAAADDSPSVLLQWAEFQEKVQALTDEERLVFDLHFHLRMPKTEVAEVLRMEPRAVNLTWLRVAKQLKGLIPKMDDPPAVLIVSGGTAYTTPAANRLFDDVRAFRLRAVGGADAGPPSPTAVAWASVVCVTRPEYADVVRRLSAAAGKPVVCLDLPDAFDAADKAHFSALWERVVKCVSDVV